MSSRPSRSRRNRRVSVSFRGSLIAATKTFVSRRYVRVGLADSGTDFLPHLSDNRVHVLPRQLLLQTRSNGFDVQLLKDDASLLGGSDEEFRPLSDARGIAYRLLNHVCACTVSVYNY